MKVEVRLMQLAAATMFFSLLAPATGQAQIPRGRFNGGFGGHQGGGYNNGRSMGGSYRGPNGASGFGHVGNRGFGGGYQAPGGAQYGGHYQSQRGGWTAVGNYRSQNGNQYGGNVQRSGNRTIIQGEYRGPGRIPYTQDRWRGGLDLNGRNSNVRAGYDMYDSTGRLRIAGGTANLNRHGYNQMGGGGVGGVQYRNGYGVRFQGSNSTVHWGQGLNAGVASGGVGASGNRHGVSGNASGRVGGVRLDANARLDHRGLRGGVQTNVRPPAIRTPSAPRISAPRISAPRISAPRISAPRISAPKISRPKVKIGF